MDFVKAGQEMTNPHYPANIRRNKITNLTETLLLIDFAKVCYSIHREKMIMILTSYGIPTDTVNAIMILYQ